MSLYDYENVFSSSEAKAAAFDRIAELYYHRNFGTAGKSEIDLIMFGIYLDELVKAAKSDEAKIDYDSISDHKLAKVFGITPQKIKSLKMKKHLSFDDPEEFDLQQVLSRIILKKSALTTDKEHNIVINIPDPFVYSEIKDYIESHDGMIDSSFNSQLMKIPQKNFFELCELCATEDEYDELMQKINEYLDANKTADIKSGKDLLDKIQQGTEIGKNIVDIMTGVAGLMSPGTGVIRQLLSIFK